MVVCGRRCIREDAEFALIEINLNDATAKEVGSEETVDGLGAGVAEALQVHGNAGAGQVESCGCEGG